MFDKVYIVLEEFASENGASIKGVYHNLKDAKKKFSEVRNKRLNDMRGYWIEEDSDITEPLTSNDLLFSYSEFKDNETEFVWYDRYGDQFSLTIEEEKVL